MSQPCGCCAGIEILTPGCETNPTGLSAIAYRVGTHATFFESMLARLSTLRLEVPSSTGSGSLETINPLKNLTTRELSDPSIALMDAWALVADVLSFYQERIANEGYLGTATERRSILELARLIGYKLRPGVSASVFLAFTVADGFVGTIPTGTRAQSIPGTGEKPQFFETSADLPARDGWNSLKPRLTRPQLITLASDPGTDAGTRDTLYFQGTATNLKAGDALLIVLGDGYRQQKLRMINSVEIQAQQNRTEVTLQESRLQPSGKQLAEIVKNAVEPFIKDAASLFSGTNRAAQVAQILQDLITNVEASDGTAMIGVQLLNEVIPQIQEKYDIAARRGFTRLAPWTSDVLDTLNALAESLPTFKLSSLEIEVPPSTFTLPPKVATSSLAHLATILKPLTLAPSVPPPSSLRLARTLSKTFSPQADMAPRLLTTFKPALAKTLYRAWGGLETPTGQAKVYALRVKASLFGHNAPLRIKLGANGNIIAAEDWPVVDEPSHKTSGAPTWHENNNIVYLDSNYDKIAPYSWLVVQTTQTRITTTQTLYAKAVNPTVVSRGDYGMSGKATKIELGFPSDPDDSSQDVHWITQDTTDPSFKPDNTPPDDDLRAIRETMVYAQAEELKLAEEPLDRDVEGDTLELAELYDGLDSGRRIIVSGERTDIPDTAGVMASELAMIAGVEQGSREPNCAAFPFDSPPFIRVYYTTDPNAAGDRLMVGELPGDQKDYTQFLKAVPRAQFFNQQFCGQVELGPDLYTNAFVPTPSELEGAFPDFDGLLINPENGEPYEGGVIGRGDLGKVFAWRISSVHVHTVLTLAEPLAYSYDSSTVTIYGNVAKATHGQTVGEVLGNGDGRQPLQKFKLGQSPLTYLAAPTPAGAESTLVVRVNEIEWHESDSLADLGPKDHHYITQTDDSDKITVVFGTGEHGSRLPTGNANVKATYRYGIGKAGNVAPLQISQLASQPLGLKGVINPLPATGGADRDTCDQARRNAPVAVAALDRLVSVEDYADFARTYAGIGKARSARLSDGRRLVVHVTIAGVDDIPIDPTSDLYQNLLRALSQYGDPYLPIQLAVRHLQLLVISAGIKLLPDYQWEFVEPKVRAALLNVLGFDRRKLGQSACLSEAISAMQAVEGVSYVNPQTFDAVPENIPAEQLAALASTLELKQVVEAHRARVEQTATEAAKRILPADLAMVTPDIPDTLLLTQITS